MDKLHEEINALGGKEEFDRIMSRVSSYDNDDAATLQQLRSSHPILALPNLKRLASASSHLIAHHHDPTNVHFYCLYAQLKLYFMEEEENDDGGKIRCIKSAS